MRGLVRRLFGAARGILWLVLVGSALLALLIAVIRRPEDLPWTPLRSLDDPVGAFTAMKLAKLDGEGAACRSLLTRAGFTVHVLPPLGRTPECAVAEPIRIGPGSGDPALDPGGLPLSCPFGASLAVWERAVVEPAARSIYGQRVVAIDTFGSYNCRRIYGRSVGDWSEHARANAIDVAGFRLANGHRVTVAADWRGKGRDAAFLHRVHDGACQIFATVLSPDYNAAHRDHLHLDQAQRGAWGWRACR